MCSLCDAYSLLPNRWMMVNLRATRDTVVQGFERPRAPPRPHAGPAPRSYLTMHCALMCAESRESWLSVDGVLPQYTVL